MSYRSCLTHGCMARTMSGVVTAVMLATFLGAMSGVATADEGKSPAVAEAPDVGSALLAARESGRRVEVLSERTEYAEVFAEPAGNLTLAQHVVPQRVQHSDGSWAPVDATLRVRADGSVAPKASVAELAFSGGGDGLLARIAVDDYELGLSWPGQLPRPLVAGSRATYPEILPGVDLALTANAEGFSEVLVVKSRQAAKNPALDLLTFKVSTLGVRLQPQGGGFVGVDSAGETVFTSPPPLMWDSSGLTLTEPGAMEIATAETRMAAPVHGDRLEQLDLKVAPDELRVRPDRAMLDDPRTVYPVYIDPTVSASRNEWAMIASAWPDQEYHNFAGDQGMGYCDVAKDSGCVRSGAKRLVWEFGIPSGVHGAQILAATFKAWETSAYDCTADWVELWQTGGISSGTNWNNHASAWQRYLHSVSIARRVGCANEPGWVEFNATAGAVSAAAGRWSTLTLGLKAYNEGSMPGGWKRFRYDAVLSITYNSYPTTPTGLSGAGKACGTGGSRPVVADATPDLLAIVHDPDAAETDLAAEFVIQEWDTTLATPAWVAVGSAQHGNRKPNDPAQVTVGVTPGTGPALAHGGLYRWQARTLDPWSWGGQSGTLSSPWSAWCEFEVDTKPPDVIPDVFSAEYPDDGEFHGSVGDTGSFTFRSNGVSDVKGYRYGWADPPTAFVAATSLGGDSPPIPLTPPPPNPEDPTDSGPLTLYVVSVDRADQESDQKRYQFLVGSASGPVGQWLIDEPAEATTLVDSSGNGRDATAVNVALGAPGRLLSGPGQPAPTVGSFNGASSVAATAGPVLDTGGSFTVSAWARITNKNDSRAVLSQDGVRVSGFALGYAPTDRWVLDMYSADDYTPAVSRVSSTTSPRLGAWTHLAAVYDHGTAQMRLYVDGVLADTEAHTSTWSAQGALVVGRARYNGAPGNLFGGDIADVRVWDRVLSGAEITPMATTLVGRWALDGDGTDWSAYGRDVNATGSGVSWPVDDRIGQDDQVVLLDGSTGWLSRSGPVVRTDQSFTVAAWVKPSALGDHPTVVSQCGTSRCAFYLQYNLGFNQWALVAPSADVPSPTAYWSAKSGTAPTLKNWVHLVGVHDASSGQLRLYVNGGLLGTVSGTALWHASGTFYIGRADTGVPVTGAIDEVQVYAGAMPATDVTRLYETSP